MSHDYNKESVELHKKHYGKIELSMKLRVLLTS